MLLLVLGEAAAAAARLPLRPLRLLLLRRHLRLLTAAARARRRGKTLQFGGEDVQVLRLALLLPGALGQNPENDLSKSRMAENENVIAHFVTSNSSDLSREEWLVSWRLRA